jgi:GT2 family glycosyltransferase
MQPRVTAILVARNGAEFLEHTLAALRSQTRRPDATVFVDAASQDASAQLLANAGPTQFVSDTGKRGFGGAVAHGVQLAPPATSEDDWIWLLSQDSAPHPRALENLLGAVEIAPSVAIAGPKLMRWDRPDTISEYGESITRFGSSVALVDDELDQAQHDLGSDLLGVAAAGMLVRRSVWAALGGFDPALPSPSRRSPRRRGTQRPHSQLGWRRTVRSHRTVGWCDIHLASFCSVAPQARVLARPPDSVALAVVVAAGVYAVDPAPHL